MCLYCKSCPMYFCPYFSRYVVSNGSIKTRVERCNSWCPKCLNRCTLKSGHDCEHECYQGHTW